MISALAPRQVETVNAADARLNIWHGSVRSGKTVASQVAWLDHLRRGPAGPLLMVGKTARTLKRNVLDPLEEFLGPARMRVSPGSGEAFILGRKVYLAGANDERAESKIRGLTLAGAYGDEFTTWPEGFFKMLLSRLSLRGARLFGTTNPDAPLHWLKKDFIDRESKLDLHAFHFSVDDNPYLDPAYVAAMKLEYVGLWYKRFILGQWVLADGPVYDMLDDAVHVVDGFPPGVTPARWWAAVDYGTSNPFVLLLFAEGSDGVTYVFDEWRWDSKARGRQITDAQYREAIEPWLLERVREEGALSQMYVDPSAASFVAECSTGWLPVCGANNDVVDGIRAVSTEIAAGRLKIFRRCEELRGELGGYVWDPRKQAKGEDAPLKVGDHGPDALRYGVYSDRIGRFDPSLSGWS